jgi:hypothetical protein
MTIELQAQLDAANEKIRRLESLSRVAICPMHEGLVEAIEGYRKQQETDITRLCAAVVEANGSAVARIDGIAADLTTLWARESTHEKTEPKRTRQQIVRAFLYSGVSGTVIGVFITALVQNYSEGRIHAISNAEAKSEIRQASRTTEDLIASYSRRNSMDVADELDRRQQARAAAAPMIVKK